MFKLLRLDILATPYRDTYKEHIKYLRCTLYVFIAYLLSANDCPGNDLLNSVFLTIKRAIARKLFAKCFKYVRRHQQGCYVTLF